MMRVLSLFAGVGGIDLGLERAGMTTVAQVEIDDAARGVLADHWPDVARFTDVREVTAGECIAAGFVPRRGVIAAGFPCQDISVAGRRAGLAGARSGLFWEIVRLADALRPQWLVLENVPGLLSSNAGRDMGTVLGAVGDLGYGYAYRVLDAQHFGVPQRRRRVFIVGRLGDAAGPVRVLLEPESRGGDSAPGRATRARAAVGAAVSTLQGGGRRGHRVDAESAAGGHLIPFDAAQITHPENRVNPQPGDPSMPLAATGQPHIAYALSARQHGVGQGHNTTYVPIGEMAYALRSDPGGTGQGHNTTYVSVGVGLHGETSYGGHVSPSVTGSHGHPPGLVEATAVRRLTPRECERLQGFPDDWTATSNGKAQTDSPRYRQLGNAVAVPVLEWIGRRIVAVEARRAERNEGAA